MKDMARKGMTSLTGRIELRLLLALMAGALLVIVPLPAFAAADNVNVEVSIIIPGALAVEYTGPDVIEFVIGYDDLVEGSKGIVNQGDLLWWATIAPWWITIERTEWDTENGDPDLEFWLQVKYGPPDNDSWVTVPVNTDPEAPANWIYGTSTGSGMYEGIDWKIKNLTWDMQPGFYWCTVTISIVPA